MTDNPDTPGNPPKPGTGEPRLPPVPGDVLLNKHEVASLLGGDTKPTTVVRRWRSWGLHAHRVGRELRWWRSDVYQWINANHA